MWNRLISFLGVLQVGVSGLLFIALFVATPWGYYHAFTKHGSGDGWVSVVIPPYAWYRAVESAWHDDFADVDWARRTQNDARTAIILLNGAINDDASVAGKVAKAIENFSKNLAEYPDDKRATIKALVDTYLAYVGAFYSDMNNEFDREASGTGDGTIQFQISAQTLALENQLRQYPALEDVLKNQALAVAMINEKLGRVDLNKLDPSKRRDFQMIVDATRVAAKVRLERMRRVHLEMFGA